MKKGWEEKKFVDIFTINPQKREVLEQLKKDDPISFVPMKCLNVQEKQLTLSHTRTLGDAYKGYTYFADNDVLLAKITPCFENGKVGIAKNLVNGIGFGSSEYIVFRSNGEVIPEYLFYYISQESFRNEGKKRMAGAVGHKRVSKEFIENYYLSYPESIDEQKRIVKILDKAFAATQKAKENAEKNLQNSKELFDSYLQNVFTNPGKDWEEKRLGEVTSKIGSGATPRGGKGSYKKEGISLIRSMNVHDRKFKVKNIAFIDEIQAEKLSNVTVEKNDVLLNITGASIARCCIVDKELLPARVNQHVSIIRPLNRTISPDFLNYLLTSKVCKGMLLQTGEKGGSTRQALTKLQLEDFLIYFPSTTKQKQIVSKLESLSAETKQLEAIYQKKIINLEELKKSILQKAFEGEL